MQNPHGTRSALASNVLKIREMKLRVISPDVGGGFGMKGGGYPEDGLVTRACAVAAAAGQMGRDRFEALLGDAHGRDQVVTGELALDGDAKISACASARCTTWARTSSARRL